MKPISLIVLLLFILSGCALFPEEEKSLEPLIIDVDKKSYKTYEVIRQDIESVIARNGAIHPAQLHYQYIEFDGGILKEKHISLGQDVVVGDLLFELDTSDLYTSIQTKELLLESALYDYELYETVVELQNKIDKEALEAINNEIETLRNDPEQPDSEGIAALELSYEQKSDEVEVSKLNREIQLNAKKTVIDLDQILLDNLLEQYEQAFVNAEYSGEVVYVINLADGDYIPAYEQLIGIADLSKVLVYVNNWNDLEMEYGKTLTITYNEQDYTGHIVLNEATVDEDLQVQHAQDIYVEFDTLPENYGLGDSVSVKLVLEHSHDAIVVPKHAIHESNLGYFLYVLEDQVKKERYVEIGIESYLNIEILDGLDVGELVVLD